ncbi:MAG: DUF1294 domain-containing protein [Planctomycetota bacterium]
MKYLLIAALVFNLIALAGYVFDKWLAKRERSRISEARLYQLAFFGPVGAILGVWWVRHKTRKFSFLLRFIATVVASILVHALVLTLINRWPNG